MTAEFEPGALWVTPTGDAYRLRDYGVDWRREPFTGEREIPSYNVLKADGMSTSSRELPGGSLLVWEPPASFGNRPTDKENDDARTTE